MKLKGLLVLPITDKYPVPTDIPPRKKHLKRGEHVHWGLILQKMKIGDSVFVSKKMMSGHTLPYTAFHRANAARQRLIQAGILPRGYNIDYRSDEKGISIWRVK